MSRWKNYKIYECGDGEFPYRNDEGVYVFFGNNEAIYIGESTKIGKRLNCWFKAISREHNEKEWYAITPWGNFKHVSVKYRFAKQYGESAMAERKLIRRINPRGNIRYTGRKNRQPKRKEVSKCRV